MILWLTCTHGRVKCLERNLRCYLDQTFTGKSVMFICNSGEPLKLPDDFVLPDNKAVYIDNCKLMNFQSVGEKYQHALELANRLFPEIIMMTSADDDDLFLPDHLDAGFWGFGYALVRGMNAYKPKQSWFRYRGENGELKLSRAENTLEPSIFVDADWIKEHGYAPVSVKYHQQWLDPLITQNKIFVDPEGTSTLIYNWGDNTLGSDSWNIYKMSGSGADNQNNFEAHKRSSLDMGNGILTPAPDNSEYYQVEQT